MSMEHRWSTRKPVCLNAVIFYRPLGLIQVTIQNIGLEGAFIHCAAVKLPYQAIVEMSFALDVAGKQTIYQMQAMLIHHTRNGYGLMFKDYKLEAFRALKGMLYAA
jgi:hypothetical protein